MPMLQAALLCDSAQEYEGKMSILGGFISVLNVSSFPTLMPVMFVGRISLTDDELGKPHEFQIEFKTPFGEQVFSANASAVPSSQVTNQFPELYVGLNLVLQLPLAVKESGLHWVHFHADGLLMASLPLLVRLNSAVS